MWLRFPLAMFNRSGAGSFLDLTRAEVLPSDEARRGQGSHYDN